MLGWTRLILLQKLSIDSHRNDQRRVRNEISVLGCERALLLLEMLVVTKIDCDIWNYEMGL